MNNIKKEQNTTVKIYREFFIKAEAEIRKQLLALKSASYCKNCRKCCKIRYSEFSPEELRKSRELRLKLPDPMIFGNEKNNTQNADKEPTRARGRK